MIDVRGIYFKSGNTEYALIDCPFCGRVHMHGYGNGSREPHCADYYDSVNKTYIRRTWIKKQEYNLVCEKYETEKIRLLAKRDLETHCIKRELPWIIKRVGKTIVNNGY